MATKRSNRYFVALFALVLSSTAAALSGCDSASDTNPALSAGHAPGVTVAPGTPASPAGLPAGQASANTMTIAVKYVALRPDANSAASPTKDEVITLFNDISKIWSQCDIRFVVEEYSAPLASDLKLNYYPANQSELEDDRRAYDNKKTALYVKTGTWNRAGDLGNDGSNGFSTVPPADPEGTVVEQSVDTIALLVAHETGHLIGGLGHTTDTTNLMDHFVSTKTTQLTQEQCNETRAAMQQYHAAWLR